MRTTCTGELKDRKFRDEFRVDTLVLVGPVGVRRGRGGSRGN